jgi:hypothetical protein
MRIGPVSRDMNCIFPHLAMGAGSFVGADDCDLPSDDEDDAHPLRDVVAATTRKNVANKISRLAYNVYLEL